MTTSTHNRELLFYQQIKCFDYFKTHTKIVLQMPTTHAQLNRMHCKRVRWFKGLFKCVTYTKRVTNRVEIKYY